MFRVPTQIVFSNSLCFPCVFPVQSQFFPVPISIICDYYIHKTDLAYLSSFWEKNGNCHGKYRNILYLWHQGIYNLRKQNSLSVCFGKISKFPVFSLTGIFFGHFPCFPCFPCAVGTLLFVCLFVKDGSLISSQLTSALSRLFVLVLRHGCGDRGYEMRCLFVAVGLYALPVIGLGPRDA